MERYYERRPVCAEALSAGCTNAAKPPDPLWSFTILNRRDGVGLAGVDDQTISVGEFKAEFCKINRSVHNTKISPIACRCNLRSLGC